MSCARYDYPTLKARALAHAEAYNPQKILIEDTGVGTALIQELRNMGKFSVTPIKPERDKLTRNREHVRGYARTRGEHMSYDISLLQRR